MLISKKQSLFSWVERLPRPLAKVVSNPFVVSAVVGVGIWWLLAGNVIEFLPTPYQVAGAFVGAITSSEFYIDMAITLRRVLIIAVGAWLLATILGIAMASSWPIETAINPLVFIGLAIPAPLGIYFAILIFGLGELTSIIALFVIVTPYVAVIIYGGAKARDKRLVEMAAVFRFSRWQQLRDITLPELAPSLMSGARFAFAMGWKLVVLVELLSSNVGIGERLQYFFVFNQPARVIGWTLTFTVIMVFVERYVFATLEKKLLAWRPIEDAGKGMAPVA
ncbi:MAG: ABC transporter permease subunit [Chloroflexi bacterium]|nr:ABC transporter permease subunit [Chloroflexota bacterium]